MLPVIALVGRPNVGKSTLFNQLTRSRDALVADQPGLTRDRQYGFGRVGPAPYIVVDTGGLSGVDDGLDGLMAQQTQAAVDEADVVLFLVDGREGPSSADSQVAELLRRRGSNVWLVVNKCEGQQASLVTADFFALGIGEPVAIAATHGQGVRELIDAVFEQLEDRGLWAPEQDTPESDTAGDPRAIRVAVVGRPNVGKSTLINRLIGEDRLVAFDLPGTTRDAVEVPFEHDGQGYTLIDTAGVRRRARVSERIEKFSVVKTLQAVDKANVVIAVLDAAEGVAEQDVTLLGMTLERGRALVIAVNKWDGLDTDQRNFVRRELERRLPFLDFARILFVSALH
ncbi:MAG: ribosome biogenesis GTPase Der, partial [Pseudomonadota bacterium]